MEMFFYYRNLHAGDEVVFVCVPSSLGGMESAAADYGIELFQLPDSGLLQDLGTAHVCACISCIANHATDMSVTSLLLFKALAVVFLISMMHYQIKIELIFVF